MTTQTRLTLHMEGLPADSGDMRLPVFADKLAVLKSLLSEADRIANSGQTTDFLVTDLTHSSPAAITITEAPCGASYIPGRATSFLVDTVRHITAGGNRPAGATYFMLEKVAELVDGLSKKMSRMWFSRDGEMVATVNKETQENVLSLLQGTVLSLGSVTGRIKRYNSGGKENSFHIFSMLGVKVKCIFDASHIPEASAAVEKNVTVYGELKYRKDEFFPFEVDVHRIEVNPSDSELPRLSDLAGAAPSATGGVDSPDFIRLIRNGWH